MTAIAADFTTAALTALAAPNQNPAVTSPAAPATVLPTIADLDGSDLVAWAAAMVDVPDVPASYRALILTVAATPGLTVTVAAGKRTRGALLIRPAQIGISLGDGRVIVPAGDAYQIDHVDSGSWTGAALCPGVSYR